MKPHLEKKEEEDRSGDKKHGDFKRELVPSSWGENWGRAFGQLVGNSRSVITVFPPKK
jgi:hypothetical protein